MELNPPITDPPPGIARAVAVDIVVDPTSESFDIIDEAIDLFRANILFKTFELQSLSQQINLAKR